MNLIHLPINQSYDIWEVDNGEWKLKMEYNNENSVDINLWPLVKCKEIKEFGQRFAASSNFCN